MNRCFPAQWMTVISLCAAMPAQIGCENKTPPGAVAPIKATPEQSFSEIVRIVTQALETGTDGMPSAQVWSDAGSRSQFVVNNKVTSELIPPNDESGEYRGTITVTSRSYYSFRHSRGAAEGLAEGNKTKNGKRNQFELPEEQVDEFGSLNDGLISAPPTKGPEPTTNSSERVDFREDEDVRIFRLAYEGDRWVLKTQPDAEKEQAVRKAFDFALKRQL